MCALARWYASR
jgi:hypothetical protein